MTKDELNLLVGSNIRKYILIHNAINNTKLSQTSLANQLGVTTPLIGQLESSKNPQGISVYYLYQISKVLDVPIEKFFEKV